MRYENIKPAKFIDRPNRFTAHVEIAGEKETVHVKNTGRCRELLVPGAEVYLTEPCTPGRKTKYDLIAVRKGNGILFNIDSQAPNKVVREWLDTQGFDLVQPEHTYGSSRIDFYMERGEDRYLMEVKGCTLEVDGIGYFPDAPTERGCRLCDPDGRRDRGQAQCPDTSGVWHGTERGGRCGSQSAADSMPC